MIVVKLNGGLGNQMFQYAFGLAIEIKLKQKVFFDLTFYKNTASGNTIPRPLDLHFFGLTLPEAPFSLTQLISYPLTGSDIIKFGIKKVLGARPAVLITEKNVGNFFERPYHSFFELYFQGYWQSEDYFIDYAEKVRDKFSFHKISSQKLPAETQHIKHQHAVSIHFRRGDYVSNPAANQHHGVCSIEYYYTAVNYLASQVKDPVFYIFSDDPAWVKENFHVPYPNHMVSSVTPTAHSGFIDLYLMHQCKHHIVANSSFSWWGAWLNAHPDKIVIAPKQWFSNEQRNKEKHNLIPKRWICL